MAADSTPSSKSQKSSSTHTSTDQLPTTPRLPFDPPHRRSSLAFSKVIESPVTEEKDHTALLRTPIIKDQNPSLQSNIDKKRIVETPFNHTGRSPCHVESIQKVLQTARANLHLDVQFAASPVGSIDSRLPSLEHNQVGESEEELRTERTDRSWRYSNIPKLFSVFASDVREPLPDDSPTLPVVVRQPPDIGVMAVEPTSSGFASPLSASRGSSWDCELNLPPLPISSPSTIDMTNQERVVPASRSSSDVDGISELTQPMTGLKVAGDADILADQETDQMDESPITDHLRRKSCTDHGLAISIPDCPDSIFLSQSARAAAESAKLKRGLLLQVPIVSDVRETLTSVNKCPDPSAHRQNNGDCPDPDIHRCLATRPCPEPLAHVRVKTPEAFADKIGSIRAQPRVWGNDYSISEGMLMATNAPTMMGHRTTATGSPMPFAKRTKFPLADIESYPPRRSVMALTPAPPHIHLSPPELTQRKSNHIQKPSEHFRPGWHYASRAAEVYSQPNSNLYSFSTAAAKVTGESAAPDSRIRDSYRTDTLTPLARPPGRFRKTGIAATLQPSRSKRYHNGLPRRFSHGKLPPDLVRRFGIPHYHGTQSKSSPTRPSTRHVIGAVASKRGHHDSGASDFDIAEDGTVASMTESMRSRPSEGVIHIDEQTRAAIRMSIFGRNTPECLHGEREGIRELSPNVNIWRKGMSSGPPYRKKRRPSYWDGDLEEVRMSPAGRGGIASSPPLSKRSMVAELESISSQADTVAVDENTQLNQEQHSNSETKNATQEVNMTDITELEA